VEATESQRRRRWRRRKASDEEGVIEATAWLEATTRVAATKSQRRRGREATA
jgi:hypothetical protein